MTEWGGFGLHCDKWAWLEGPLRQAKLSNLVIDKSLISRIPEYANLTKKNQNNFPKEITKKTKREQESNNFQEKAKYKVIMNGVLKTKIWNG